MGTLLRLVSENRDNGALCHPRLSLFLFIFATCALNSLCDCKQPFRLRGMRVVPASSGSEATRDGQTGRGGGEAGEWKEGGEGGVVCVYVCMYVCK